MRNPLSVSVSTCGTPAGAPDLSGTRGRLASAAATDARSASGVIGLRRKSVAPSRIASTASSIDANAVTMITRRFRQPLLQLAQGLEAVHPRHLLIEQHGGVVVSVAELREAFFTGGRPRRPRTRPFRV